MGRIIRDGFGVGHDIGFFFNPSLNINIYI